MFPCNLLAIDTRISVGCVRNAHHSNDNDQGQQKAHSAVITAQNGRFMKPCVIIYIYIARITWSITIPLVIWSPHKNHLINCTDINSKLMWKNSCSTIFTSSDNGGIVPVYCHTTDGPPGPSAATMDGPPGPCTAATLGPGGTIYGT